MTETTITAGVPDLPFRDESITTYDPPCAEYADGGTGDGANTGGAIAPLSVEEADRIEADRAAREQELLDAAAAASASDRSSGTASSGKQQPPAVDANQKPVKSPASHVRPALFLQVEPVDVDAVNDLWAALRQADADALAAGGASDAGDLDTSDPDCILHYWCGGERVDDVLFGRISDAPEGTYFTYVNIVGDFITSSADTVAPLSTFLLDRDALATSVATSGFGDQPSADLMPVFYSCLRGEGGTIELSDPTYEPSFAWATTIQDQYDVEAARRDAQETIRTTLAANLPQMQTIPPIERGFSIVKLPMWLWLENIDDLQTFQINAVSEEATVRLVTRATLVDVTWQLGDATIVCEPGHMKPFILGDSQITDETPDCSHMFTQLGDYQMTATARFHVQEQVSYRGSDTFPWPDAPWTDHPTDPYATVSNQTGTMTVHQFTSVNVPIDQDLSANPGG